jgi:hypothetical protein
MAKLFEMFGFGGKKSVEDEAVKLRREGIRFELNSNKA